MMRTYDSYKDSGIEWIGEIPRHWEIKKLRFIFNEKKSTQNLSLNSGSISFGQVVYKNDDGIPEERKETYQEVLKGEFLINPLNLNYDLKSLRIGMSSIDVVVSSGYIVLKVIGMNSKGYFSYLLRLFDTQHMKSLGNGIRQTISYKHISNEDLVLPPLTEQEQIVSYLDEKTSLIDEMVEKKKRKIELLKEYRTSLINTVVTKGLNPDIPMKDSGIEWIGEIPRHWESSKLKYLFHIIKNISGELGYDILSVTQKGVKIKDISKNEGQLSMDYSKYQLVNEGQFVMNHMDLLTGFIDISKFNGVTSPDYRVFESYGVNVLDRYYLFIFQLCYLLKIFYGLGSGVSNLGRWRLPSEEFLNFILPLPPITEQEQIVTYLDKKTSEIDKTIELENKKIELLKEYRQSLISNVVTGKIKVVSE